MEQAVGLPDWAQHVSVGGIFLILVLRTVLDFLKEWRDKKDPDKSDSPEGRKLQVVIRKLEVVEAQVQDLHTWHSKTDGDGVPVWYRRRSMEEAIVALTSVLADVKVVLTGLSHENQRQTDVLAGIAHEQQRQSERLAKLSTDIPILRRGAGGG